MGQHANLVRPSILCALHASSTPFSWSMLKYPIPKAKRIGLARLYFHLATTPGMPNQLIATCADAFQTLTKSKKKLSINDMRLPWKPIYEILKADLFLSRRQFEYTCVISRRDFASTLMPFYPVNSHGTWGIWRIMQEDSSILLLSKKCFPPSCLSSMPPNWM